jgi:hypothetical protein
MSANQATFPVRVMCRLLGVSATGFYAWHGRPLSARAVADIGLTAKIHAIHHRSGESSAKRNSNTCRNFSSDGLIAISTASEAHFFLG